MLGDFRQHIVQDIYIEIIVRLRIVGVVMDLGVVRDVKLRGGLRPIEAQMQMCTREPRHEERDHEKHNDPAPAGVHSRQHSRAFPAEAISGDDVVRELVHMGAGGRHGHTIREHHSPAAARMSEDLHHMRQVDDV
jgi:hypothetical protein